MQIGRVAGTTRVLGQKQGYLGLPVRDEKIRCNVASADTPAMVTAWFPTPKEIDAIKAGAPVLVRIMGVRHPPIMVDVGEPPDDG